MVNVVLAVAGGEVPVTVAVIVAVPATGAVKLVL